MILKKDVKVFIADDHGIVRDGIKALLHDVPDITIVGEACNGKDALDKLKNLANNIDVVLMDVNMPVMDGIEATGKILEYYPSLRILALSMHDDESHIISMLQEGISGYILKTTGQKELTKAIRLVASGQNYFTQEASEVMLEHIAQKRPPKRSRNVGQLTRRESEILKLIAEEYTNHEIAERLCLSQRT
ncbi:MAG: response regulator transcription factor, partial [Bacteroidota bacterium]